MYILFVTGHKIRDWKVSPLLQSPNLGCGQCFDTLADWKIIWTSAHESSL